MKHLRLFFSLSAAAALSCSGKPSPEPAASADPETRIVRYLEAHVKPGEEIVVSQLYGKVFKTPEEQRVLDRLFDTFFKIPLRVVQFQETSGRTPTLEELSGQFGFTVPGEMNVILKIMESDPRVPRFLERDGKTGEITRIDAAAVRSHPQFGKILERSVAGLTGKRAPAFSIQSLSGDRVDSGTVAAGPYALYFWFSQCPPCMQTTPLLVELNANYAPRGFKFVAVNADRVLDLSYTDVDRAAYVTKTGMTFLNGHLTPEMQRDYGGVALFPTFVFVDGDGFVSKQLAHFQEKTVLDAAIVEALGGN